MFKRLTPDAWQRHITSWQQSGLSQKAYCQQHQLGQSTFHNKYRALKGDNAVASAKPLTVLPVIRPVPSAPTEPISSAKPLTVLPVIRPVPSAPTEPIFITIQSPQGWRLECPLTIPALTLTTLLSVLP